MIYETLHKKLKIEQHELHKNNQRFYWNEELLYYPGFSIFWKLYDSLKIIPLVCLRVRCVPKIAGHDLFTHVRTRIMLIIATMTVTYEEGLNLFNNTNGNVYPTFTSG